MSAPLNTDQHEALEYIAGMRERLNDAERHIRKGQLYASYKCFLTLKRLSFGAASYLSDKTTKAARDWGHIS